MVAMYTIMGRQVGSHVVRLQRMSPPLSFNFMLRYDPIVPCSGSRSLNFRAHLPLPFMAAVDGEGLR